MQACIKVLQVLFISALIEPIEHATSLIVLVYVVKYQNQRERKGNFGQIQGKVGIRRRRGTK